MDCEFEFIENKHFVKHYTFVNVLFLQNHQATQHSNLQLPCNESKCVSETCFFSDFLSGQGWGMNTLMMSSIVQCEILPTEFCWLEQNSSWLERILTFVIVPSTCLVLYVHSTAWWYCTIHLPCTVCRQHRQRHREGFTRQRCWRCLVSMLLLVDIWATQSSGFWHYVKMAACLHSVAISK